MSEWNGFPIPHDPIQDHATAVRNAINVYSQAEVDALLNAIITNSYNTSSNIINTITATGVSVSTAQRIVIRNFIAAEVAASRWGTVIRRFYLPGWGNSQANAIDWVSLTSGSFVNGATHGTGFVQGNGTTQYFDMLTTPASITQASGNASLFAIVRSYTPVSQQAIIGCGTSGLINANQLRMMTTTADLIHPNSSGIASVSMPTGGVVVGSATSTTNRFIRAYYGGGFVEGVDTDLQNSTLPNINMYAMARNLDGPAVPTSYSSAQYGCWGAGLAMTTAQSDAFAANLRTLWQSLFNLTLP